ncbi:MAG: hypothetical protein JF615_03280 [Asticcacaulis sp.]|nr:hypothetical protein [Asticcacaulis sp.]
MQSILEIVWFPIIAMLAVIFLTVWALSRDSRRRRRLGAQRTVVITEADDDSRLS